MKIRFSIIFILSLAGGAAWGYYNQLSVLGYIISLAVAGFIGSSIISLIFIYLYFSQADPAPEPGETPSQTDGQLPPKDSKEIKQIER